MANTTDISDIVDKLDSPVIKDQVLKIFNFLMGSMGIAGNLLVIVVMLSLKNIKKKVSGLFVINLAIADFLTGMMLVLTTALPDDGRVYKTLADEVYCRLWLLKVPLWGCLHTSTWCLVVLTLERYLSVVHPVLHRMKVTYKKALVVIALVWACEWTFIFGNFLSTTHTLDGECHVYVFRTPAGQRASGAVMAFLNYFTPLFILTFCYTRMVLGLRRKLVAPATTAATGQTDNRANQLDVAQRNVIKTLVIVCLGFILCASWAQWFFFLFNIGVFDYATYNRRVNYRLVTTAIMFANCCINPIIYTLKYKAFQSGLKKMVCAWRKNKDDNSSVNSTSLNSTSHS